LADPQNGAQSRSGDIETYRLHVSPLFVVAAPEFSPDGRYILFQCGDLFERGGLYRLYVLDRQTKTLVPNTPDGLSTDRIAWSPDSQQILFFAGRDQDDSGRGVQARVFDLLRRRSFPVAAGVDMAADIADVKWTSAGTLLFTQRSSARPSISRPSIPRPGVSPATSAQDHLPSSNVFETGARLRSRLLLSGAEHPLPSPDGQWIAFFGSPDGTPEAERDQEAIKQGLYDPEPLDKSDLQTAGKLPPRLILYNRQTKKRLPLSPSIHPSLLDKGTLLWTSDSKNLVRMEMRHITGTAQAAISTYNLDTRQWAEVALLQAKIEAGSPFPPELRMVSTYSAADSVLVKVTRYRPQEANFGLVFGIATLQAVDIRDGRVREVCEIKGGFGDDWHAEQP